LKILRPEDRRFFYEGRIAQQQLNDAAFERRNGLRHPDRAALRLRVPRLGSLFQFLEHGGFFHAEARSYRLYPFAL